MSRISELCTFWPKKSQNQVPKNYKQYLALLRFLLVGKQVKTQFWR
jgi:hypothetical protein